MNIEYIKTAFSADCSKNFDGKNMVQIMGKIWPIYVPYFAHGVLHSKFLKDFNSHSHTGVTKVSTKNHTFVWFIFLP